MCWPCGLRSRTIILSSPVRGRTKKNSSHESERFDHASIKGIIRDRISLIEVCCRRRPSSMEDEVLSDVHPEIHGILRGRALVRSSACGLRLALKDGHRVSSLLDGAARCRRCCTAFRFGRKASKLFEQCLTHRLSLEKRGRG